jgi:LysR family transcriptional regulator, glycine cleavage system transcriptional activator
MALRLPPLSALRLFEAAGRHASFKLAAAELHVTPSAVSHGIVALERWLGIELFERGPRGLALTEAGRDYLPYVSEALTMIATGTQRLPSKRADRKIVVSSAPTFAARVLLPHLASFRARHPDISVAIDSSHRQVGFPVDGVDLAIRMGRGPWPGLASTRLLGERLVPVCAPAYLATLGGPPPDLTRATLIYISPATEDWAAWVDAVGFDGLDLSRGLTLDTIQLGIEAAIAGLGVLMGRRPLIDRELADGQLVPASDHVVTCASAYWLVGSEAAQARPDIAAFKRWLIDAVGRLAAG